MNSLFCYCFQELLNIFPENNKGNWVMWNVSNRVMWTESTIPVYTIMGMWFLIRRVVTFIYTINNLFNSVDVEASISTTLSSETLFKISGSPNFLGSEMIAALSWSELGFSSLLRSTFMSAFLREKTPRTWVLWALLSAIYSQRLPHIHSSSTRNEWTMNYVYQTGVALGPLT